VKLEGDFHLTETVSSHPKSANYGKHWTAEQVTDAFAPSKASVEAVREWLVDSGIASERIVHSDNKAWLAFDAYAEELEELLNAEYHQYEHIESDKVAAACDE
jgi:tripeptidyl-peptidase-1